MDNPKGEHMRNYSIVLILAALNCNVAFAGPKIVSKISCQAPNPQALVWGGIALLKEQIITFEDGEKMAIACYQPFRLGIPKSHEGNWVSWLFSKAGAETLPARSECELPKSWTHTLECPMESDIDFTESYKNG